MKWVLIAAVLVGLVFGLSQVIIPNKAESDAKDRLTKEGGSASVTITAFPAIRLLFNHGEKLEVRARDITIPINDLRGGSFKKLDGFNHVRVRITSSTVGPFTTNEMLLKRDGGEKLYHFTYRGSTSVTQLAELALAALPLQLRSLVETLTGRPGRAPIPIVLNAQLESNNGKVNLVSGGGTVAGLPLGGLSLAIAGAVISRVTG
jgi:hypothetical protein